MFILKNSLKKPLKRKSLIFFFFFFMFQFIYAQETILTTGGNGSGNGGSISYSIGQVAYTTLTGVSVSIAQGVQQPYEISVVTSVEQVIGIKLTITVYPNPTSDFLTLNVDNYDSDKLTYQLYDINGRLLESNRLDGDQTRIDMGKFTTATYLLQVLESENEIKTFKIIKK